MASSAPGPWQRLYKSRRWERRSRRNLQAHKYLCQECLKANKTTPATLSHHLNEFQPNFTELEFFYGELTALCHDCHFKIHHPGYQITRDFEIDIGTDGFPIDRAHPFWKVSMAQEERDRDE
jgi:5-methylcytosine-specific restriction protein A